MALCPILTPCPYGPITPCPTILTPYPCDPITPCPTILIPYPCDPDLRIDSRLFSKKSWQIGLFRCFPSPLSTCACCSKPSTRAHMGTCRLVTVPVLLFCASRPPTRAPMGTLHKINIKTAQHLDSSRGFAIESQHLRCPGSQQSTRLQSRINKMGVGILFYFFNFQPPFCL